MIKGRITIMPLGVIINSAAIIVGGCFGLCAKERMSSDFKEKLNMVFGVCAMGMGISTIALMKNMPAVIFAMVIGTALGIGIHLGEHIQKGAACMQRLTSKFIKNSNASEFTEEEFMDTLITVIVLFCSSGTGIYGSIVSGMTGDHSILIAKSILDFFTAMIFACSLGGVVSLIAIPQFIIFMLLYAFAGAILPLTTPDMIDDFKAAGGFIMLATGFRMIQVKMFPTADMIPAMALVLPVSWMWTALILPFL